MATFVVCWYSPCHTKPHFHCIGMELFNFLESCETARKPWYFCVKKGLSWRSYSYHGVATEFQWRSYGVLVGDSLRSHDTFTALTMHALCFHGIHTALTMCWKCSDISKNSWHLKECHTISMQRPRTTTAFTQLPLCAPVELLLHCRRLYCAALVTLRWPHCAPIRKPSHSNCFEHAQTKMRAIVPRSMRSHSVYWGCHCIAAEMLVIILRAPRRSALFLTLWEHWSGVTGV